MLVHQECWRRAEPNLHRTHLGGRIQRDRHLALKLGLKGPMRSAGAGPDLKVVLTQMLNELGPYPHGPLKVAMQKPVSRNRPRAKCNQCGYQVPMLKRFLAYGPPICPKDKIEMDEIGDWEAS
ncbi:MAG: hypothetical protein EBR42_11135 [Betaproteobacteria bacterium]|nr:hypothetical protein [Betaproteobacteria bacterium]